MIKYIIGDYYQKFVVKLLLTRYSDYTMVMYRKVEKLNEVPHRKLSSPRLPIKTLVRMNRL